MNTNIAAPRLHWKTYDLLLTAILILSVFSLINLWSGGTSAMIAATDKPGAIYGDFNDYYYPAGRMILSSPKPLGGYFYTPAFAILLHGFALDSQANSVILWQIVQHLGIILLLFVPGIYLAAKGGRKLYFYLYILLFLTSFPLYHNLKWGQMSIIITFASIFSIILHDRGHKWSAALLLTLASLVKYYPAALIFYFLIKRDFGFIARFSTCMLLLGLAFPAAILGLPATLQFYQLLNAELAYALDWVLYDLNSQYLPHVVIRLFSMEPDVAARGSLSLVSLCICVIVFLKMYRTTTTGTKTSMLSASAIFLLLPMLINTSWPHYFVFLPFCTVLLLQHCSRPWQKLFIVITMLLQSLLVFSFTDYKIYSGNGLLLAADLLLLILWFSVQKAPPDSGLCGRNPEVSFSKTN